MEGRFEKMALSDKKKVKLQEYGFVVSAIVIQLSVFVVFYIFCNFQSILMAFQLRDTSSGEVYWTFQNFSNIWDRLHATTGVNLWDATKHTFGFFILWQIDVVLGCGLESVSAYYRFARKVKERSESEVEN